MGCDLTTTDSNSNSNKNNKSVCCCPSCGEPAGKNFIGSGGKQTTFNCFKCGEKKEEENYYKCKKCNCFFCIKCPYLKNEILAESHSSKESYGANLDGGLLGASSKESYGPGSGGLLGA